MSGALVPANGSGGFQTQGQIDWVALSSSTINISIAALQRLSKAGVDPYTVQVGKALCWKIDLAPKVQDEMNREIAKLKTYGILNDMIWFGFGIKQTIHDLADTEEGLSFVTLCSALVTAFDVAHSAQTLRELCKILEVPRSATPSQVQWRSLVHLCGSGILLGSHFEKVLHGFSTLVSGSIAAAGKRTCSPQSVANVVSSLISVQDGALAYLTVIGNADFGWLAAFAEQILLLDIEIVDSTGQQLYRSQIRKHGASQVSFKILLKGDHDSLSIERTHLVPQGHQFVRFDSIPQKLSICNLRSTWSTILQDSFGPCVDYWISGPGSAYLPATLLQLSANPDTNANSWHENFSETTLYSTYLDVLRASRSVFADCYQFRHHREGIQYLDFIRKVLPELNGMSTEQIGGYNRKEIREHFIKPTYGPSDNHKCYLPLVCDDTRVTCKQTVVFGIILMTGILLNTEVDEHISPSSHGLRNACVELLWWFGYKKNSSERPRRLDVELVKSVFTNVDGSNPEENCVVDDSLLARCNQGICVYRRGIEDPTETLSTLARYHIVRGHILFDGESYRGIKDHDTKDQHWVERSTINKKKTAPNRVQALINIPIYDDHLRLAYRVSVATRQNDLTLGNSNLGRAICCLFKASFCLSEYSSLHKEPSEVFKESHELIHMGKSIFTKSDITCLINYFEQWHEGRDTIICTWYVLDVNSSSSQAVLLCSLSEKAAALVDHRRSMYVRMSDVINLEDFVKSLVLRFLEKEAFLKDTTGISNINFIDFQQPLSHTCSVAWKRDKDLNGREIDLDSSI